MDAGTRLCVDLGADLVRYGLSTPDQVRDQLIGYSHPDRDGAMALVERLVASRGLEPLWTTDRGFLLNFGADILAQGLTTPEAIAANLIDPATPDQDELLHAICTLATVRKGGRPRP
jgi:hypothetical protein